MQYNILLFALFSLVNMIVSLKKNPFTVFNDNKMTEETGLYITSLNVHYIDMLIQYQMSSLCEKLS